MAEVAMAVVTGALAAMAGSVMAAMPFMVIIMVIIMTAGMTVTAGGGDGPGAAGVAGVAGAAGMDGRTTTGRLTTTGRRTMLIGHLSKMCRCFPRSSPRGFHTGRLRACSSTGIAGESTPCSGPSRILAAAVW